MLKKQMTETKRMMKLIKTEVSNPKTETFNLSQRRTCPYMSHIHTLLLNPVDTSWSFHPGLRQSPPKMFINKKTCHTVDGRNPAPPGMCKTMYIIGYLPYQLVQDLLHHPCVVPHEIYVTEGWDPEAVYIEGLHVLQKKTGNVSLYIYIYIIGNWYSK